MEEMELIHHLLEEEVVMGLPYPLQVLPLITPAVVVVEQAPAPLMVVVEGEELQNLVLLEHLDLV